MSMLGRLSHYPLVERLAYYLARARAWWRRTTMSGLAVRGVVWATGLAAILLALPPVVPVGPAALLAVPLCLLPASMPQGRAVSSLLVGALALLAVGLLADSNAPSLARVGLAAGILYLHHSAAALAAQIRTDAVVPLAVVRYWATRAGIVLATTAVLIGLASALPSPGWSATGHIGLGVLAALGIAGALLWPLRKRG